MDESIDDDADEDLQTLTFDDLLSFACQVAKGMEFLSAQNVRRACRTRQPSTLVLVHPAQIRHNPNGTS